jgi:formate-dependent phosphoribosylglycinamide formyltransferase (GAR transformylase)
MRIVVYVAPFPLQTTLRFGQALAALPDVRLCGVFQKAPPSGAPFADVELVDDALDTDQIAAAVQAITARNGPPHRVLGILENIQEQLAEVRARLGVEGMDPPTAQRFRDKGIMKDALRAGGIPCARYTRVHSEADAREFIQHVGFPVVFKPPAGAGCRATYRVRDEQGLSNALAEMRPSPQREVLAEEFLTGSEFSFETLTLGGDIRFSSIGRYLPTPLEVMETPWLQWVVHLPRDISGPEFAPVREIAPQVNATLGLDTAMTHMEWFRRPDGSVAIGEIAARPPGARIVDMMSWAHDRDLYEDWARLVVFGEVRGTFERRHSVAIGFLRGKGRGRVSAVLGVDAAHKKMGHLVVDRQLPIVGAPRSDTYEGDGWVILRHHDDDVVQAGMRELITTVQVEYA